VDSDRRHQCPYCMRSRPLKAIGEFHQHTRGGGPGGRRHCEASGLTPEQARELKRHGPTPEPESQHVEETAPDEIF
jgi:hypothetical protein